MRPMFTLKNWHFDYQKHLVTAPATKLDSLRWVTQQHFVCIVPAMFAVVIVHFKSLQVHPNRTHCQNRIQPLGL